MAEWSIATVLKTVTFPGPVGSNPSPSAQVFGGLACVTVMPNKRSPQATWFVYILECSDHSLYTGCTNDVVKRLAVHNSGKGAKYTRSRVPVRVVYTETAATRSEAAKREAAIKKLSTVEKQQLIATFSQSSLLE